MAGSPDSSGIHAPVRARTLDLMVEDSERLEAVERKGLRWGDWIIVETRNSVYTICVLDNDRYTVSGGWFDRKRRSPMTVAINGCTWGGSAIRRDVVAAPGLFLEFGNRVMTTRIRQVRLVRTASNGLLN